MNQAVVSPSGPLPRKKEKRYVPSGLLPVGKPVGPTSHDVVIGVRRALGTDRVGHCGTLDPLASGLLLLAVEGALKEQGQWTDQNKIYRGVIRLGLVTDTDDLAGKTLSEMPADDPRFSLIDEARVRTALGKLTGDIDQQVPRYCAVKVDGKRLYEWAREGAEIPLPVKKVRIDRMELIRWERPDIEFRVACSKGTYVRSLARDIGAALGVGGTLAALEREAIGGLTLSASFPFDFSRPVTHENLLSYLIPSSQIGAFLGASPKTV